jgi:microcystin-dependent protein
MPAHSHIASVSSDQASSRDPQNNYLAVSDHYVYSSAKPSALVSLSQYTVSGSGGNIPHNNVQPYLVVTFIVALSGIFPSRG